jgi:WD40 repeat protein
MSFVSTLTMALLTTCSLSLAAAPNTVLVERQLTTAACGHILTNANVWSPDGRWIVYDVRSDPAGEIFDGSRIERVNVDSGRVELLYKSSNGAHCGVASFSPVDDRVLFILGPEKPTPDWSYAANHRRGVIVDAGKPGIAAPLDARDLTPPFTAGALRGGTHLHLFDGEGKWVAFTYEDAILSRFTAETSEHQVNLRGVGVSIPGHPVHVPKTSTRNRDGDCFSVLVTTLHANPQPDSDQISKASEEAWVGTDGYQRQDHTPQAHAIAFHGQVVTAAGKTISELFIVDLPNDLTHPGSEPLQGTTTMRPAPPAGCVQRRLTFTADRKYPGLQGPRHWPRSSPNGRAIAFLMKDDDGIVQIWTISPNGGSPRQVTHNPWSVESAFTWSPDGKSIACVMDDSVFVTDVGSGNSRRLTQRADDLTAPRPEACVFSPDGNLVAYVRRVHSGTDTFNQIFVVRVR